MKIAILGYSGAGKSTLAKNLADIFNIDVLHLDTVQFEANWVERNRDEAILMVKDFMKHDSWVIDGNYTSFLQKERLAQADKIIFLDFPRWNCLKRAFCRYLKYRNTNRESMAVGCDEKMDLEFIWWILSKGRSRQIKQHYKNILSQYKSKSVVIKNQRELNCYLSKVSEVNDNNS